MKFIESDCSVCIEPLISKGALGLGVDYPIFLPVDFTEAPDSDESIHHATTRTIRKVLEEGGLATKILENEKNVKSLHQNNDDFVLPAVLFCYHLIIENPNALEEYFTLLFNYCSGRFKWEREKPEVSLDCIVETSPKKTLTKVSFSGPVEGLKEVPTIVKAMVEK